MSDRALTYDAWRKTLEPFIVDGTHNERRMAQLLLDVFRLGDAPIQRYMDETAVRWLDELDGRQL